MGEKRRGDDSASTASLQSSPGHCIHAAPIVLNAANEVAVAAFLDGRITFTAIPRLIREVMDEHTPATVGTVAAIRKVDASARDAACARVADLKGARYITHAQDP